MSIILRAGTGACAVALVAAIPAAAQSRADDRAATARIAPATVTVTGKRLPPDDPAIRIERTPGGVDHVPAEDYGDRLAVSLRDALAWSPGVFAQARYGQEVRLSIRGSGISRGAHLRGLLLLQDGMPLNLADNNGDFQELDPQVLERLEVYRGGNALRFGGSTLGGAINAVSPTGRSAPGLAGRVDGGAFATLRALGSVGFATDRGDAFLALTGDRSDGDRRHATRAALRFNGNVGVRLSDRVEHRLYATLSRIDQDIPGFITRAQALSTPAIAGPDRIALDNERNMDSLRLQSRTTIALDHGSVDIGGFVAGKDLDHPIFQILDQKSIDGGVFARAALAGAIGAIGAVPVEATFGVTARWGRVRVRNFLNVAGRRGALTSTARQAARTIDSYVELRARPLASLTLVAGGVHSHGFREVINVTAPARSGAATLNAFSPKLGLLWQPAPDAQVYANYSRSVELPGLAELNQFPFAVGGAVAPGFVPLDPQRAWTAEIGTRGRRGGVAWDVTLYRADIRGELLQFAQAPDIPAATFNALRTRHQGIEASLDWTPLPWLRFRQAYQLNDFTFRGDAQYANNRLPVVPEQLYRAEIRLGTDRLSVSPGIEWVPRGAWADYVNATRSPGYALFGLGAQARLSDRLAVFLDARNVAAKKAIGDVSAVVRATPASVIYFPVERRGVYGGVRARF